MFGGGRVPGGGAGQAPVPKRCCRLPSAFPWGSFWGSRGHGGAARWVTCRGDPAAAAAAAASRLEAGAAGTASQLHPGSLLGRGFGWLTVPPVPGRRHGPRQRGRYIPASALPPRLRSSGRSFAAGGSRSRVGFSCRMLKMYRTG